MNDRRGGRGARRSGRHRRYERPATVMSIGIRANLPTIGMVTARVFTAHYCRPGSPSTSPRDRQRKWAGGFLPSRPRRRPSASVARSVPPPTLRCWRSRRRGAKGVVAPMHACGNVLACPEGRQRLSRFNVPSRLPSTGFDRCALRDTPYVWAAVSSPYAEGSP